MGIIVELPSYLIWSSYCWQNQVFFGTTIYGHGGDIHGVAGCTATLLPVLLLPMLPVCTHKIPLLDLPGGLWNGERERVHAPCFCGHLEKLSLCTPVQCVLLSSAQLCLCCFAVIFKVKLVLIGNYYSSKDLTETYRHLQKLSAAFSNTFFFFFNRKQNCWNAVKCKSLRLKQDFIILHTVQLCQLLLT